MKQEKKKMAVINLTCDFPNEYCVAELARWARLSTWSVRKLVMALELDVSKKENNGRGGKTFITEMNTYFKKEYENRNNK